MPTRILMSLSATFMAALGLVASFMPQEMLGYLGTTPENVTVLLMQVTGALYIAFAMLNWMSRGNIIGGIYARPLALANFLHFSVVSIVLVKYLTSGFGMDLVAIAVPYVVFAGSFGIVLFTQPAEAARSKS